MRALICPRVSKLVWHEYFVHVLSSQVDRVVVEKYFDYSESWIQDVQRSRKIENIGASEYLIMDVNRVDIGDLDGDVYGFTHGGAYEPYDLEYKDSVCTEMEREFFPKYKRLFVATEHQRQMVLSAYPELNNVRVTAFPYIDYLKMSPCPPDKDGCCYAGQLNAAKGYDKIELNPMVRPLRLETANTSRSEYVKMLGQHKSVVVPSRKETFGIVPVEAIQTYTVPLMPYRLSFPEIFGKASEYEGWIDNGVEEAWSENGINEGWLDNKIESSIAWANSLNHPQMVQVISSLYASLCSFIKNIDHRFI